MRSKSTCRQAGQARDHGGLVLCAEGVRSLELVRLLRQLGYSSYQSVKGGFLAWQQAGLPVVQSNAWGMLYGTIITAVIAVLEGHEFVFDWSAGYVGSLLYLTVFGSIVAFGAYLTLLGRIGAHKAGYAMVMFPVVALILSAIFEDLEIDATVIIGTLLVLAGNVFVLNTRVRRVQETPRPRQLVMPTALRAVDVE